MLNRRYGLKVHVTPWQNETFVLRMFEKESMKLLRVVNDALPIKLECMRYKLEGVEKYGVGLAFRGKDDEARKNRVGEEVL